MDLFENYSEYDDIVDLWYSWLYCRLHLLITKEIINVYSPRLTLDVGCGTGFQSFLHAFNSDSVIGIDGSRKMIRIAQKKAKVFNPFHKIVLFPEQFKFVERYNQEITSILSLYADKYTRPHFLVSNINDIPFSDETFDHVNCCGSVLSLIDNSESALTEIRRILKPGGTLFIEVESRWNFDILWILFNKLLANKLNYYNSSKDFFKVIFALPHNNIIVDYPYGKSLAKDAPFLIKIKLFTQYSLKKDLDNLNFEILKKWNIHGITNLIPSTILHKDNPSLLIRIAFSLLSLLEENINHIPFGNSTAYLLQKI